jgi:hypothetical protein
MPTFKKVEEDMSTGERNAAYANSQPCTLGSQIKGITWPTVKKNRGIQLHAFLSSLLHPAFDPHNVFFTNRAYPPVVKVS